MFCIIIKFSLKKLLLISFIVMSIQLSAQKILSIRHINIIEVKSGTIKSNQIVSIKGNRIDFIGNDNSKIKRKSEIEIDGTNKYLIPGLWDMHIHDIGNTKEFFI